MTNEEMYGVIFESLQNDINDEKITFEFGNILNDIAYEAFIEGAELSDEVSGILDRYLTEATADMEDEESVQESADDDSTDDDVINESVMNIITAYENAEITEDECKLLLESAGVDMDDVFTEASDNVTPTSVLALLNRRFFAPLEKYSKKTGSAVEKPSLQDLAGTDNQLTREIGAIEAAINKLKSKVGNSKVATEVTTDLLPSNLINMLPSNTVSVHDFSKTVLPGIKAIAAEAINITKKAITNPSANLDSRVVAYNRKKSDFYNATSNLATTKIDKKELTQAEANAAANKKRSVDKQFFNSRMRHGTLS